MAQGALAHIALTVNNLDKAMEDWRRILSVLDPGQLIEPTVIQDRFGPDSDPVRWATFVSRSGAEIQLVEPLGDGPRAQALRERGEFVDHICFVTPDPEGTARRLAEMGVELTSTELSRDHRIPWQGWTFVTEEAGHGVRVEIAYPYEAVDGRWVEPAATEALE